MEDKNLELIRVRDSAISSFLAQNWVILKDHPDKRQCVLRMEWTFAKILIALVLLLFWPLAVLFILWMCFTYKTVNY